MIYFVCYLHSLSYLWISTPPPLNPSFTAHVHPLSFHPPPWPPRLSCISVFLSGLACVEPAACVVALVCQRWNGCGWQASGRQRETGAEEAWLTDGSADTLRAWEEMRGGGSCSTTAPPLSPPPACSPYISLSALRRRSHSRSHLLPFKRLCVFPFTLYPSCFFISFLSFSSSYPFLAPMCPLWYECSSCPLSCSCSRPPLCIAFAFAPHPPPPLMDSWLLSEDG